MGNFFFAAGAEIWKLFRAFDGEMKANSTLQPLMEEMHGRSFHQV